MRLSTISALSLAACLSCLVSPFHITSASADTTSVFNISRPTIRVPLKTLYGTDLGWLTVSTTNNQGECRVFFKAGRDVYFAKPAKNLRRNETVMFNMRCESINFTIKS